MGQLYSLEVLRRYTPWSSPLWYSNLKSSNQRSSSTPSKPSLPNKLHLLWQRALSALLLLPLDFATNHLLPKSSPTPPPSKTCSCGTSVAEAKSLNCIYDELAIGWLPPHCIDSALTAEFSSLGTNNGSWPYYLDQEATIPLTLEEISLLADDGTPFYTTHEWYLVHCNYSWRKFFRSSSGGSGVVMDVRNHNFKHTVDCGELQTKYHFLPLKGVSTRSENGFGYV